MNPVAIAEQLTYEYRSMSDAARGCTFVAASHHANLGDGVVTLSPYRQLRFAESPTIKQSHDYQQQLMFDLRQAMQRQFPGGLTGGINLSGGFDSRVAVGFDATSTSTSAARLYIWYPWC